MSLARQHLPCLGVVAAHDDEDAAGEAGLLRQPQMMEDVDAAGAAEQPALAAFGEEIGEFRYAGRGGMEARNIGREVERIGDQRHLAEIGHGAQREGFAEDARALRRSGED